MRLQKSDEAFFTERRARFGSVKTSIAENHLDPSRLTRTTWLFNGFKNGVGAVLHEFQYLPVSVASRTNRFPYPSVLADIIGRLAIYGEPTAPTLLHHIRQIHTAAPATIASAQRSTSAAIASAWVSVIRSKSWLLS